MKTYFGLLIVVMLVSISACDKGVESPRGFSLPKGDAVRGEQVFVKHQCLACHQLDGIIDESVESVLDNPITLGGERTKVTTYAELVTSVINPSHKIARDYKLNALAEVRESPMRNYNDVMTVSELVDLVTYLQPHYKVQPIQYTEYGRYY